jgi:uncharacterized membrane protein
MTVLTRYATGLRASIKPVLYLREDRMWEIDALRGVAIVMMVIYHFLWDLRSLGGYDIALRQGFWNYWQIATASLFTGLVGLSLTLSYNRERETHPTGSLWSKYIIRGLTILTWGVVIGVVTYLALGITGYVRFGILHLIGVSIILAYPFLRFRWLNLALGALVILVGTAVPRIGISFPWLEWLAPTPGTGVDYAPLFPWFGRVLIGIFLGNTLYAGGVRRFSLPDASQNTVVKALRLFGENSLLIYLIHQPIMIITLFLLGIAQFPG